MPEVNVIWGGGQNRLTNKGQFFNINCKKSPTFYLHLEAVFSKIALKTSVPTCDGFSLPRADILARSPTLRRSTPFNSGR